MYLSACAVSADDDPDRNGSDRTARNGVWPSLSPGRITSIRSGRRRWEEHHHSTPNAPTGGCRGQGRSVLNREFLTEHFLMVLGGGCGEIHLQNQDRVHVSVGENQHPQIPPNNKVGHAEDQSHEAGLHHPD